MVLQVAPVAPAASEGAPVAKPGAKPVVPVAPAGVPVAPKGGAAEAAGAMQAKVAFSPYAKGEQRVAT